MPVDVPMPLAAGQSTTAQFNLNYDGLYLIEINATSRVPDDTLRCLLGVEADAVHCKNAPSAIAANWILSSAGHEVKRGSSDELHSVPAQSEGVTRVIGEFPGRAGGTYNLQVTFRADAKQLAATNPRLRVEVASIAFTDLQSARVLVFAAAFICIMFGATLLGVAWFAKKRLPKMAE